MKYYRRTETLFHWRPPLSSHMRPTNFHWRPQACHRKPRWSPLIFFLRPKAYHCRPPNFIRDPKHFIIWGFRMKITITSEVSEKILGLKGKSGGFQKIILVSLMKTLRSPKKIWGSPMWSPGGSPKKEGLRWYSSDEFFPDLLLRSSTKIWEFLQISRLFIF